MPPSYPEPNLSTTGIAMRLRAAGYVLGASLIALIAADGPLHAQSFSVGANFTTITRSQTNALVGIIEPPDTMGAAGPDHFVAFNNGSFSIFSKNGALVSQASDTSF